MRESEGRLSHTLCVDLGASGLHTSLHYLKWSRIAGTYPILFSKRPTCLLERFSPAPSPCAHLTSLLIRFQAPQVMTITHQHLE